MSHEKYHIHIDMIYAQSFTVNAKTEREAKKIAWERYIKRNPKKKNFTIHVNKY
jgi:hypothetical protein